jgi:hypothetical protein
MLSALDVHYDLGDGHPLLGRRMPDLDIETSDGPTRVFTFLHDARPVLFNFGEPAAIDVASVNPVRRVTASTSATCELPVLGLVGVPPAVLVRPDGHVAWTGELDDAGLGDALTTWFGTRAGG